LICVLECCVLLLYWMECDECLDGWSGGGCGVFIAPNHQFNRWKWLLSMGAPDSVRCASHVTQPLGFWRFRLLELCLHVAPDRHCSLSGAPSGGYSNLCVNCPCTVACRRPLQSTVAMASRCSAGAPDSPMAHRTVRWIIAERRFWNPKVASLKSYDPGAPDTVRWHTR
jgi:hypothetical protein